MTAARRTSSLLALIGAGALLLAGCASGAAVPASSGSASETPIGGEIRTEAGWLDGGRFIGIVTDGSSTCVPTATDATVQADGTLAVTLDNGPADKACTADMVPRVSLVGVPEGVDPTKDLDIVVTMAQGGRGDADLDGLDASQVKTGETDYLPSAGWVDDDQIAILTWGSSTCAPVVGDVTASDPKNVMVTFADLGDKPCTMDMAPRATLISVAGLDVDDDGASVTLSGGDAQFATPVTVAVIG